MKLSEWNKLQWRSWDVRDARNMECLQRKATGSWHSWPKREAIWEATSKAIVGPPNPTTCALDAGHGAIGFNVCLAVPLHLGGVQGLRAKSLPWVFEETDFWAMLGMLRFWRLLEVNWMHFAYEAAVSLWGQGQKVMIWIWNVPQRPYAKGLITNL
jgi:hypothetical protein